MWLKRSREDSKIWRPYNRNTAHVECKNKGDTSNNRGDWDYFKVIHKIGEQHSRNEVATPKKIQLLPVVRDQYVGNFWCFRLKSEIVWMKEAQKQLVGTFAPIRVWRSEAIRRNPLRGTFRFGGAAAHWRAPSGSCGEMRVWGQNQHQNWLLEPTEIRLIKQWVKWIDVVYLACPWCRKKRL